MEINRRSAPTPGEGKKKSIKKSRISIRVRLFSGFALFAAILLVVLWLCQVVFFEEIYKLTKISEIKSAAGELTAQIDRSDIASTAEEIGERKNVCISIMLITDDKKAETVVSAHSVQRCLIHNPNIASSSFYELYQYIEERGGSALQHYRYDFKRQIYYAAKDTIFNRTQDELSIVYTVLMKDAHGNDLMIMLNSVITPMNATVRTLQTLLGGITILVVLLSVLLAGVLTVQLSRPLIALNDKAKRLAKSDYSVDFTSHGYREVSELGETLNQAEEQLSKVDRLKTELIANISHDLRTPLTLISGYAEVMRDIPGESTPENLQIIIDETGRLTSLVNEMLDISKLQSGTVVMTPEHFPITRCLYESLERYNKLLDRQDYRIILDADADITVYADKIRFEQAFFNLLNNAITHTGADKTVYVYQRIVYGPNAAPIGVRILVQDTGEGIPASELPHIWDRYYKVDKVHKRSAMGSGLGLSIVKTIIERMNGRYGVESTPGMGSTFWIELPF